MEASKTGGTVVVKSQTHGESLAPKLSCPVALGLFLLTYKLFTAVDQKKKKKKKNS
jgi:hypothetical protein